MKVRIVSFLSAVLFVSACSDYDAGTGIPNENRIQPYAANEAYWQLNQRPVLLLGGSNNDNLFQSPDVTDQLEALAGAGGNYVRSTMSSRDEGDLWAFDIDPKTRLYDLTKPNPEYWDRFESFLTMTADRNVVVQLEIWATFDFYDGREMSYPRNWSANPYNPKNNINYTSEESGLPETIPSHPTQTQNPFFFSVPGAENNTTLLPYQEAFVDELLVHSLPFGHVLYCMDNETSVTAAWGAYWSSYVRNRAEEQGILVQTTEMWDPWNLAHEMHNNTFDYPDLYSFVDVSQNNHQKGQAHWDNAQRQRTRILDSGVTRPLSNVKIYGADGGRFGSTRDGLERFWRNILGGMASSRFHRPDSGIGISETAQTHIRSMRMLTDRLSVFTSLPANDQLLERDENEAYAMANEHEIAVFFPNGGEVKMKLSGSGSTGTVSVTWLDIAHSSWLPASVTTIAEEGPAIGLAAPDSGYWAAYVDLAH